MNRLLRVAVSAALLTWIAFRTDWTSVSSAFAQLRLELWLAAVVLLLLAQLASAARWKLFADHLRLPRSLRQLTGFYFIGMYFNLMLPTSVGGDVVRAWYLDGRSGRRLAAFATVFLDRLNGLIVLVTLGCLAAWLCPLDLPPWIGRSIWGIAGCGVLGLVALTALARFNKLSPQRRTQLRTMLRTMRHPRLLARCTLLSVFVQVASVLILWLVGLAIAAPVPAAYYWVLVPLVSLLTLLPVSVNGMGVREGAMVLLLAPLGIDQGTALTLSLLWFAVSLVCGLAGGLVYLFGHFPKPETPATVPAEVRCGSVDCDPDQGRTRQHHAAA